MTHPPTALPGVAQPASPLPADVEQWFDERAAARHETMADARRQHATRWPQRSWSADAAVWAFRAIPSVHATDRAPA